MYRGNPLQGTVSGHHTLGVLIKSLKFYVVLRVVYVVYLGHTYLYMVFSNHSYINVESKGETPAVSKLFFLA